MKLPIVKKPKKASKRITIRRRWLALFAAAAILQQLVITQIFYPADRLSPFLKIDGVDFSGWSKNDVAVRLDKLYANGSLDIYLGSSKKPYLSPKLNEVGLSVSNQSRVGAYSYPWYLRLIPTSLFWGQKVVGGKFGPTYKYDEEKIDKYISDNFGTDCKVAAKNASLKYIGGEFVVVPSQDGGDCDKTTLRQQLLSVKPRLNNKKVVVGVKKITPEISDAAAQKMAELLTQKVGSGIEISVDGETQTISAKNIFSWMDFDIEVGQLVYSLNSLKASDYIEDQIAPKVTSDAGVTKITTYDFNETYRVNGTKGQGIDTVATLENIKLAIEKGEGQAEVVTKTIEPTIVYTRGYSQTDSGLTALLQQYATDHAGISSVALVELSGDHRRAVLNGDNVLVSASTYKLFVAYSTLVRIENGKWNWTDKILDDGRDLAACFSDMIKYSSNDCAEAMGKKIGYSVIDSEIHTIGCTNSSIVGKNGYAVTSANDLALFLAQLQTGQMLTQQTSRDTLINAMKQNIYRSGIPSGVSYEVADKVGFIDDVLNDAAIVYSPNGPYVLVIMTKGSSWATIADLANKIETLRAQ